MLEIVIKAANWMYDEVKSEGVLSQEYAVEKIDEIDERLIYENDNGNPAISKLVLKEFKNLHKGKAVWDGYELAWYWEDGEN